MNNEHEFVEVNYVTTTPAQVAEEVRKDLVTNLGLELLEKIMSGEIIAASFHDHSWTEIEGLGGVAKLVTKSYREYVFFTRDDGFVQLLDKKDGESLLLLFAEIEIESPDYPGTFDKEYQSVFIPLVEGYGQNDQHWHYTAEGWSKSVYP